MSRFTIVLPMVCVLVFWSGAAMAQEKTADGRKPNVVFDHLKNKVQIFDLDLEDGEEFVVRIANTCEAAFDYPYVAIERAAGDPQSAISKKPLGSHDVVIVYDARYGGYVFSIVPKGEKGPGDLCDGGEALEPGSFVVSVREKKWGLSFSGGFTFSGLTSPVYGLRADGDAKMIVDETDEKGDKIKLGAASFVHVFHDQVRMGRLQPALAFGLGINSDNRSEYFLGVGLRLGDLATVNIGGAFGSVSRLPNGVDIAKPVTDDNILSNLGSKVAGRLFFGVSFSFVDTKDNLKKPFASEAAAEKAPAKAGAGAKDTTAAVKTEVAVIKGVAVETEIYKDISAMSQVKICDADVKASEDGKSATVTLKIGPPGALDALTAKPVVDAVTSAIKKAVGDKATMAINPVEFAATCKV